MTVPYLEFSLYLIYTSMKAVGTVSGLFCDEIAENTSMKKMCSNDNQEDSVCTFLCHQTKSGIGMGSQDLGSHKTLNIYCI